MSIGASLDVEIDQKKHLPASVKIARLALFVLPVIFAIITIFVPKGSAAVDLAATSAINGTWFASIFACGLRAWHERGSPDQRAWVLLTCAVALFSAGNLYSFVTFLVYPSWSDAFWLSFYVLAYCSIVAFAVARTKTFRPAAWLDGATAGAGTAALVSALAFEPIVQITGGSWIAVATNLAYPAADLVLIFMLVTTAFATRDLHRSWLLLVAGFVTITAGDIVFLTTVATTGTWSSVSPENLFWPVAAALIGLAATVPVESTRGQADTVGGPLIPVAFVIAIVALLVYGQNAQLHAVAVAMSVLTLAAATLRLLWTLREVQRLANSRQEARLDFLTGLPNRRAFAELLSACLTQPGPTALIIIDLNHFNQVNDSLGHGAGDDLLRGVGQRLTEVLASHGQLARVGGDEFAVVLSNTTLTEAVVVIDKVLLSFEMPYELQGLRIPVSARAGIACFPEHASTDSELFTVADIALYQAKRDGVPWTVFRNHQANPSRERLEMLADLRSALEGDQFRVHFQPKLDLRTGDVAGVEALVRWAHPARGLLLPGEFLDLLTMSNFMQSFTAVVLEKAVSGWQQLKQRGHHQLSLAVNISGPDLVGAHLPILVADIVAALARDGAHLLLEISEDAVIRDRLGSRQTLAHLKAVGAKISVDDYGTGQTSLGYLRDLPLDELKLDRSFLSDVSSDPHNAAIVRSTVELAHSLGLPIVAEGVDTAAALDWLRAIECDVAQGFFIAPPQPLEELLEWLDGPQLVALQQSWSTS